MGIKFIVKEFPTVDRDILKMLWKQHCAAERRHATLISVVEADAETRTGGGAHISDPSVYKDTPGGTEEGSFVHMLGEVYQARGGRWVRIPDSQLSTNASLFRDFWTYAGIPWSCGELLPAFLTRQSGTAKVGFLRRGDAVRALQSMSKCELRCAVVGHATTLIGGWVRW